MTLFKDQHQGWTQRIIQVFAKKWKAPQVGYNSGLPNLLVSSDCRNSFTLLPVRTISSVSVERDSFAIGAQGYTHENFDAMETFKFYDRVTNSLVSPVNIVQYCVDNSISYDDIHLEDSINDEMESIERDRKSLELSSDDVDDREQPTA